MLDVFEWWRYRSQSSPHLHRERVAAIQAEVVDWRTHGKPGLLCTARKEWKSVSSSSSTSYKKKNHPIRVELNDILDIDPERRVLRVEPGVTMGQLTSFLNPRGWTLPVVAEMKQLTVGGLLLGFGLQSSSHKYGLLSANVESCDLVLGSGDAIRASNTENADLFNALPWSSGSLGFLTAVDLRIIPAQPWVWVEYHPVRGFDAICETFTKLVTGATQPEFIEGLMYSRDFAVIATGNFADSPMSGPINRADNWRKPWYYRHVESFTRSGRTVEYIPLRHYYHRHCRGLFWSCDVFVPGGNNPLFRNTLGWLMPPNTALIKRFETRKIRDIYQGMTLLRDAIFPLCHLKEAVDLYHDAFPLWFVGVNVQRTEPPGMAGPQSTIPGAREMFVDVSTFFGIPGEVRRGVPWDHRSVSQEFSHWLREHNGFEANWVTSELNRTQFRQMFDCELHDQVRRTYSADGAFVDVFDRLKRN
jgi:delta24-sterol reductase